MSKDKSLARREVIIGAVLLGLTILGTALDGVKKLTTSAGAVDWLVRHGVRADLKGEIHAALWFEILIFAAFGFALIAAGVCWYVLSRQSPAMGTALRTLDLSVSSAYQIRKQLIPTSGQQFNNFESVESRYLISKDFTATVTREYKIKAVDRAIYFWEINILAEHEAKAMEYLLDIDFKVKDTSVDGKSEVAYLPFVNQPRQKKIMIYFLPLLDPGELQPRTITIAYKWRGYFRHLEQKGEEIQSFAIQARNSIPSMEFEVYLEPGTGNRLLCERASLLDGIQNAPTTAKYKPNDNSPEWLGWKYKIKDAPPGDYALKLMLEKA